MKNTVILSILLLAAMLLTPLLAMGPDSPGARPAPSGTKQEEGDGGSSNNSSAGGNDFKVLRSETGTVDTLSAFDYVRGAVAAEMPAVYHEEALKAQAAACYTYAVKMRNARRAAPSEELKGADLSDNSEHHQAYLDDKQLREKWGDKFDAYMDKIKKAVQAVEGKQLLYDGEPITAAFHAICSGQTESAQVMWGGDIPYLQSVLSTGDRLSPDFASTLVLTKEQFREQAGALEGITLGDDPAQWVSGPKTSPAGTVTEITIGGKAFSGDQVRGAFGLRSACFTLSFANDAFTFSVTGYGHGVGMSQYGADYMARQGSTWEEILKHYYTGITIA